MPAILAERLCRARPPFSVNILAEAAGLAAFEDLNFRKATMMAVEHGREYLSRKLAEMGCKVYPSRSNFIMVGLPQNSPLDADGLFEALLKRGIIIRQLKSYNLPWLLRISVGNKDENHALITAMLKLLN
jgi:histidinol-phosphate aminotransferase